nr:putative HVA22-like protein g [Tanacetum cinerariifolium]
MVFGYAYPGNECFKSVEKNKPDIEELRFWCQYWVPIYSEAKLSFYIYLWFPKTKDRDGTTYVYDSFFSPYISKHEPDIDRNIMKLRTRAGNMFVLYWQRAASYGQTKIFDVLRYVASQSSSDNDELCRLGGSNDSYIRHMLLRPRNKGWRVVVLNSRGCSHGPLTTPQEGTPPFLKTLMKLCYYFDFVLDPKLVDKNTICVDAILGSTLNEFVGDLEEQEDLPDELIFHIKYLGADQLNITLKLLQSLIEITQVERLVWYIVEEAPEDAEKGRTFKLSFIVCEIFIVRSILFLRTWLRMKRTS